MEKLTRKELKRDKFVAEVEHSVEYVADHRKQFVRWGVIGAVVLSALLGFLWYMRNQEAARLELLNKAYQIQETPFGPPAADFTPVYATAAERDRAANKGFAEVVAEHPNSKEGKIAKYFLGVHAANEAKWSDAEKFLKEAADGGDANVASLAAHALAQVYAAQNKIADAERMLRGLIDKPTAFVSKEQATLTLGKILMPTRPNDGRKLIEGLQGSRSPVSRAAVSAMAEASK